MTSLGLATAWLVLLLVHPGAAIGADIAPVGDARGMLDEAKRLSDTDRAWKDREQRLVMTIRDGRGTERRRELTMRTLRGVGGEDRTITVFSSPAEVRGTSFLQFAHRDRDAEQWLYLPELRRTRQITSKAKEQSFMGTDFSYRDLELLTDVLEWTEEEATARVIGTEPIDEVEVVRIELLPRKKDVGYSRIVVGLSKPDLVIRRMEMYGADPQPRKVLKLDGVEVVGAVPTARRLEMSQPGAGTQTLIDVSEVRYDQGLRSEMFEQHALERAAESPE